MRSWPVFRDATAVFAIPRDYADARSFIGDVGAGRALCEPWARF